MPVDYIAGYTGHVPGYKHGLFASKPPTGPGRGFESNDGGPSYNSRTRSRNGGERYRPSSADRAVNRGELVSRERSFERVQIVDDGTQYPQSMNESAAQAGRAHFDDYDNEDRNQSYQDAGARFNESQSGQLNDSRRFQEQEGGEKHSVLKAKAEHYAQLGGAGDPFGGVSGGNGKGRNGKGGKGGLDLQSYNRSRTPIPGYTGHIPGRKMNETGKSYDRLIQDMKQERQQKEQQREEQRNVNEAGGGMRRSKSVDRPAYVRDREQPENHSVLKAKQEHYNQSWRSYEEPTRPRVQQNFSHGQQQNYTGGRDQQDYNTGQNYSQNGQSYAQQNGQQNYSQGEPQSYSQGEQQSYSQGITSQPSLQRNRSAETTYYSPMGVPMKAIKKNFILDPLKKPPSRRLSAEVASVTGSNLSPTPSRSGRKNSLSPRKSKPGSRVGSRAGSRRGSANPDDLQAKYDKVRDNGHQAFTKAIRDSGLSRQGSLPHNNITDAEIEGVDREQFLTDYYAKHGDALPEHYISFPDGEKFHYLGSKSQTNSRRGSKSLDLDDPREEEPGEDGVPPATGKGNKSRSISPRQPKLNPGRERMDMASNNAFMKHLRR